MTGSIQGPSSGLMGENMTGPEGCNEQVITPTGQEPDLTGTCLEVGWLSVALLAPLAVNLWARQPFEPAKAAVLRTVVWAMAGLWLVNGPFLGGVPWRRLGRNRLLGPVLAVAITQVAATIAGEDWRLSLWGSYERAQGLITLLSYLLLFFLVSTNLRTLKQAWRLVAAMVVTALPLVMLGLGQALGWNPFGLISDARSPVYVTLGRSNFLGAYLAMLLPLTLAWAFSVQPVWQRLAGAGLSLAELATIAATQARGAWLAAGVALAVFGLLWSWPSLARRWRMLAGAGGLAGLAGLVFATGWLGGQGGSAAARLAIWRATLDLIGRRLMLGYGPDALGLVFPRVFPPQLVYYQGRGVVVDRAHNLLLDWTVTAGLAGLLAGFALLAVFFVTGWRAAEQTTSRERRLLLTASLAAVGGNVTGNLVGFDVIATATAAWLLMAVVMSLGNDTTPTPTLSLRGGGGKAAPKKSRSPVLSLLLAGGGRRGSWLHGLAAGVILAAVVWAIMEANVRPQVADMAARNADRQAEAGNWASATRDWQKAVALWPMEPAYRLGLSWALLQQAGLGSGDPTPFLQRAEAELWPAQCLRPNASDVWAALGELYGVWGNRWDAAKRPLAEAAYRQATRLAPNNAMLYTAWGMVYWGAGQPAEAALRFQQAVDLDATDGYAFLHLGDAQVALGRVTEALAAYHQSIRWQPNLISAYLGLAYCYRQLGQPEAARLAVGRALQLDPGNPAAQALQQEMAAGP
jgi:tetratricopeptide (TPR) repeat protein/O-antigen ligase